MWLVLRVVFHRILTVATPVGRKVRPQVLHVGGRLVRVKPDDLPRPVSSGFRGSPVCETDYRWRNIELLGSWKLGIGSCFRVAVATS